MSAPDGEAKRKRSAPKSWTPSSARSNRPLMSASGRRRARRGRSTRRVVDLCSVHAGAHHEHRLHVREQPPSVATLVGLAQIDGSLAGTVGLVEASPRARNARSGVEATGCSRTEEPDPVSSTMPVYRAEGILDIEVSARGWTEDDVGHALSGVTLHGRRDVGVDLARDVRADCFGSGTVTTRR